MDGKYDSYNIFNKGDGETCVRSTPSTVATDLVSIISLYNSADKLQMSAQQEQILDNL